MRGVAIDNFFEYQRRLKDNEKEARKIVIFNSPYQLRQTSTFEAKLNQIVQVTDEYHSPSKIKILTAEELREK